jgi:hypothetical protein
MTEIETATDFDAMLREEVVVLFIFAEWSPPAMKRNAVVEGWERSSFHLHAPSGTRLLRVQPWGLLYAHNWLYDQPALQFRNEDGNLTCLAACGTLAWLRSRAVVDVARGLPHDLEELNRRTAMAFRRAGALDCRDLEGPS